MINFSMWLFSIFLRGAAGALFGGGSIMFFYFCFFSKTNFHYVYAGISAACVLLSFGVYYLSGKIGDRLFWRRKDGCKK